MTTMTKAMKRAGAVLGMLLWGAAHAGTVTYVYTDPQGTPLAEADASGNITARFEYTPYGVPVASMGAAPDGVGYTGHVNDPETGLVYMQARYYDAEVGRFLSVDPVGPESGGIFYFNRYAYVKNNPVLNIDPFGKCADYYEGGGCKVAMKDIKDDDKQAKEAQKKVEEVLNDNDAAINELKDDSHYSYIATKHFSGFKGVLSGKEIKKIWNSQHFSIVPNGTNYDNGGAGGATSGGYTNLTPEAVLGWEAASPESGVSSIIFHEIAHETTAGKDARRGNEGDRSGPRFQERERKVQTIGGAMARSVGAPFSCGASSEGCE